MAKKYIGIKGLRVVCEYLNTVFVRKERKKGLSTNDFTNAYKRKLDTIEDGATKNVFAPRVIICVSHSAAANAPKVLYLTTEQIYVLSNTNGFVHGDVVIVKFDNTNIAVRPTLHLNLGGTDYSYAIYFAGKNTGSADLDNEQKGIAGGTADMYCTYVYDASANVLVWTSISNSSSVQLQEGTISELNGTTSSTAKLWSSNVLSTWLEGKKYSKTIKTTARLEELQSGEYRIGLVISGSDEFELTVGKEILVNIPANSEIRNKFDEVFTTYFVFIKDGEYYYDEHKFVFRYDGKETDEPNGTDPFTEKDKGNMFPSGKYSRFVYIGSDVWMWAGNEFEVDADVDISGKADKVSGATNGNFASLDANGNLIDSGHKHSDYSTTDTKDTTCVKNYNAHKLYLVGSEAQSATEGGQTVYYYKTATNKNVFIDVDGILNCNDPSTGEPLRVSLTNHTHEYVSYSTNQILTNAQKQQARTNIGAGTSSLTLGTGADNAARGNHNHDGRYLMSLPSHTHDDRYYTESEIDDMFADIGSVVIGDRTIVSEKLSKNVAPKITDEVTTVTFEWDYENDVLVATEGYYSNWASYTEVYFGDTQYGDVHLGKCLEFNGGSGTFDEISLADATNPCYIFGIARPATVAEMQNYGAEFMGTYVLLSIDVRYSVFEQIKQLYEYEDPNTREMLIDEEHGMFLVNFGWLSGSEQVTVESNNVNFRFVSNRMATLGKVDLYQLGGTPATSGQLAYVDGQGNLEKIDQIQDIIDNQST